MDYDPASGTADFQDYSTAVVDPASFRWLEQLLGEGTVATASQSSDPSVANSNSGFNQSFPAPVLSLPSTPANAKTATKTSVPSRPPTSKRPPRKKQKLSDPDSENIPPPCSAQPANSSSSSSSSSVAVIPREKLLELSSQEFEDYVRDLSRSRPLTKEEQKEFKRQRRLIKNRESASLSRQRRKVFVSELETQATALRAENSHLRSHVDSLEKENKVLKEEVANLQQIIRRSTLLSRLFTAVTSFSKKTQHFSPDMRAASMCLLIVLFSFGMLLNAQQRSQNEASAAAAMDSIASPAALAEMVSRFGRLIGSPSLPGGPEASVTSAAVLQNLQQALLSLVPGSAEASTATTTTSAAGSSTDAAATTSTSSAIDPAALVEVACDVLDIHYTPYFVPTAAPETTVNA